MDSMVADNWESVDGDSDFINSENSQFDQSHVLMSLLDESQNEDCDDERLTNVIRSLEAEIKPNSDCYLFDNIEWEGDLVECQSSSDESMNELDFSKLHDLDFQWMDLEMIPSSPSGGMESWYVDPYGQEMGAVTEFGELKNYSQLSYGTPLMEDHDYGFLWQETNVSQMKN
ncbi:Uncharacterized protein Adt_37294 [Abeliophyllum distichum]|uniref:Uncharacterized protein n=1 Tax=Abeliophyllum distichum TaxID=126358 RepID=A0ABD1QM38_9LAMI